MKNKLIIGCVSILFPLSLIAQTGNTLTKEELNKQNMELLAKAGISLADSTEIIITSADTIINDKSVSKDKNSAYYAEKTKQYLLMHEEQQKNGYINTIDPRAKELMELKYTADFHKKKYKNVFSPTSTHIRSDISQLKMAYTFVGVPNNEMDNNFGVAPFGAYKQVKNGDDSDGWDGAVQFFNNNNIGVCAYTEHNRLLARSGVEIIKELTSYEINEKPTLVLIKGTNNTGFIYKLQWFDRTFTKELECANTKFDQELKNQVIELAKRIDSSN
ncbi:hypothetical protein [Legionella longbeachae]|uniref:hypothetical protein n=1 Tax=Legionella longbeachae TaxID=450 RepID=UPI001243DBBD|nr:hypothetical protein [Legionella longbeachae]QEY51605.1 hypothetical protein FQU71_10315 [Legionella longbeachae]